MKSLWGDFEIDFSALLGRGGMGSVYRARQKSLERDVAVKVLDVSKAPSEEYEQAFLDKFRIEARALATLCDPRIITILQSGQDEGKCWYAMELIDGDTIDARLTKRGMFEEQEAARIAAEVARALWAAQRHGIIHRDVKPANIFLLQDGAVKLGDFGLARSPHFQSTRLTEMNAVAATPSYCSPEQGMGSESDHRGDIYSLGIVLFEMLTERPPFVGDNGMETIFQHMNDEPPSMRTLNPAVTPAVEAVVRKCLQKSPTLRYQNYQDLIVDLESIVTGRVPSHAAPAPPPPAAVAPTTGGAWAAAALGALVLSFLVVSIYRNVAIPSAPVAATSPASLPSPVVLQRPAESPRSTSSPTPTPDPAVFESPRPSPDPLAEVKARIADLLGRHQAIDAFDLALANRLPLPLEEARAEAVAALEKGQGGPALRLGRLIPDPLLVREGEAFAALAERDHEKIFAAYPDTRAAKRAWIEVLAEFKSGDFVALPLDGMATWNDEGPPGKRVDRSFQGGRLAISDETATSWMSKKLDGAEKGGWIDLQIGDLGAWKPGSWFGLFVSPPSGSATEEARGRILFVGVPEEGPPELSLVAIRSDGRHPLRSRRVDAGAGERVLRLQWFRRGGRVFVAADDVLLHQDLAPEEERPEGRIRLGVRRTNATVSAVSVLR